MVLSLVGSAGVVGGVGQTQLVLVRLALQPPPAGVVGAAVVAYPYTLQLPAPGADVGAIPWFSTPVSPILPRPGH